MTKIYTKIAVIIVAIILAIVTLSGEAIAQPPEDPLISYTALSEKAEQVQEDLLKARVDLRNKRAQLRKANSQLKTANTTLKQAKASKQAYQANIDNIVQSTMQGAHFSGMSVFLTGTSPEDFLDRASALEVIASDTKRTMAKMSSAIFIAGEARDKADKAQRIIDRATKRASRLVDVIDKKRKRLDAQIARVDNAYNDLTEPQQTTLAGPVDNSLFIGGPGAGGKAAEVAMAQRGDPYVWGAEGPDSFDCSGLVLYAYRAAGISLPHSSRAQYGYGVPVTGEFKQGDLLFYGSPIHHVAMYVGDGMLVHASTFGVPVKTDQAPYGAGQDYIGAKRLAP
jgi:peptidoglycan DL-endopeptidase CwlO